MFLWKLPLTPFPSRLIGKINLEHLPSDKEEEEEQEVE